MPLWSRRQPREGRWWLRSARPRAVVSLEESSWGTGGEGLCTGTLHRCKPVVGQGSPDGASLGSSNTRKAAGEKTNAFELEDQALVLGKLKVGNFLQEEKQSVYWSCFDCRRRIQTDKTRNRSLLLTKMLQQRWGCCGSSSCCTITVHNAWPGEPPRRQNRAQEAAGMGVLASSCTHKKQATKLVSLGNNFWPLERWVEFKITDLR